MLNKEQVESYKNDGFIRIPGVFTSAETDELTEHLEWLLDVWAAKDSGWTGPWRQVYMNPEIEKKSKLYAMHDLHFYSDAWLRAVTHPRLVEAMTDLLGPNVELHHSTMHVKPPETGHPFPMHQDNAFYTHSDGRYVDVLVHLDDTRHENGEIRFLKGSHLKGPLPHVTQTAEGPCTPHLPTAEYRIADTVAVPAQRGDVVCFSIHTVHGSHLNVTGEARRLVRVGFRHPENLQTAGQSFGRPGLLVAGRRSRLKGMNSFSVNGPMPDPVSPA